MDPAKSKIIRKYTGSLLIQGSRTILTMFLEIIYGPNCYRCRIYLHCYVQRYVQHSICEFNFINLVLSQHSKLCNKKRKFEHFKFFRIFTKTSFKLVFFFAFYFIQSLIYFWLCTLQMKLLSQDINYRIVYSNPISIQSESCKKYMIISCEVLKATATIDDFDLSVEFRNIFPGEFILRLRLSLFY